MSFSRLLCGLLFCVVAPGFDREMMHVAEAFQTAITFRPRHARLFRPQHTRLFSAEPEPIEASTPSASSEPIDAEYEEDGDYDGEVFDDEVYEDEDDDDDDDDEEYEDEYITSRDCGTLFFAEFEDDVVEALPPITDELVKLKEEISKNWTITEQDGFATVRLDWKQPDKEVGIYFHCQDKVETEEDEVLPPDTMLPSYYTVAVREGTRTLLLNCIAVVSGDQSASMVETMDVTPEKFDKSLEYERARKLGVHIFQGPDLKDRLDMDNDKLDTQTYGRRADLLAALQSYVQDDLNIGPKVAEFIVKYGRHKEMEANLDWYSSIKSFFPKPNYKYDDEDD